MVMMDNVYVCRGTHGVEKVKPDPLNLSVNTVVGSNHLEFCEAVFGSLLYFFGGVGLRQGHKQYMWMCSVFRRFGFLSIL